MNNDEISRGLRQIKGLLKKEYWPINNPAYTWEQSQTEVLKSYRDVHDKAVECLDCLLAMLDDPARPEPQADIAPAIVLVTANFAETMEATEPQAEPVQHQEQERNCGNCYHSGPAFREIPEMRICNEKIVLGVKPVLHIDCTCPQWTPEKAKEVPSELS